MQQRIIVTVRPQPGGDGMLRVDDALLQVIDFIRLADEAKLALGHSQKDFDWRLKSASTNSPFTLEAVADPFDPSQDIGDFVREVKRETSSAFSSAVKGDDLPGWITPGGLAAIHAILRRAANGISSTFFDFDGEAANVELSNETARHVLPDIIDASRAYDSIPARTAYGEIAGTLATVGRWRGKPALLVRTPMYGNVWCILDPDLIEKWGDATAVSSVWRGKRLTVGGRLLYWRGGKLSRVEASTVRERVATALELKSVIDPDFTSGLDPVEYLEQLHEGRLG